MDTNKVAGPSSVAQDTIDRIAINREKPLLSVKEFAEVVGMHEFTIRRYVMEHVLPSVKISRNYKVKTKEAIELILSGALENVPATPYEPKTEE